MRFIRAAVAVAVAGLSLSVMGCSYAGLATSGDKVVVLKNNMFLFGMLRKSYVCKVTESGLSNCNSSESP